MQESLTGSAWGDGGVDEPLLCRKRRAVMKLMFSATGGDHLKPGANPISAATMTTLGHAAGTGVGPATPAIVQSSRPFLRSAQLAKRQSHILPPNDTRKPQQLRISVSKSQAPPHHANIVLRRGVATITDVYCSRRNPSKGTHACIRDCALAWALGTTCHRRGQHASDGKTGAKDYRQAHPSRQRHHAPDSRTNLQGAFFFYFPEKNLPGTRRLT